MSERRYVVLLTRAEAEVVNAALMLAATEYEAGDRDGYASDRKLNAELAAIIRAQSKLWDAGYRPSP